MTNLNPTPRFDPTPGRPTAAPAHFPYAHPTIAQVDAIAEHRAMREARRAESAHLCRTCNGKAPLWKVGRCTCGNTGLANPPASE